MPVLDREEYIEQAYLFRGLKERLNSANPVQEVMRQIREEILASTKLPLAIDFLLAELNHIGTMSSAMKKMPHYFSSFQTFLVGAAEDDRGQFDLQRALLLLEYESQFRSENSDPASLFFFQFESLCRYALDYDYGMQAMSEDPLYDKAWSDWILSARHKVGMVDLADLVYVHSEYYVQRQGVNCDEDQIPETILFGEKEGRIALSNRRKDPVHLFHALQRQLGYPAIPQPKQKSILEDLVPKLVRTLERMEVRVKLLEDEQRASGIDLSQFYDKPE